MPVAICLDGHQNLGARRELAGLLNVVSYRIEIDVDMCDVQHPCMLAPRNRAGFVTARAGRQDRFARGAGAVRNFWRARIHRRHGQTLGPAGLSGHCAAAVRLLSIVFGSVVGAPRLTWGFWVSAIAIPVDFIVQCFHIGAYARYATASVPGFHPPRSD